MQGFWYILLSSLFLIAAIISGIRWFIVKKDFSKSSFIVTGVFLINAILNFVFFMINQ